MKRSLFLIFFCVFSLSLFAQDISVSGNITAKEDGQPLPGVSVVIKGTLKGTITDPDGNFVLQAPANGILQFSYIGMKMQEVDVNGRTVINIVMESDAIGVDEVVVIGYGTQKKEDVTGAVSIVNAETIENLKPVKVEQALQGTMAGVNVTAQSGSPGADLDIRIRGISTNGDASPVAIIDGYQGDLNTLNPNDIETITVLKDAQAAIYGTVGANGIILITTKSGKKNQATKVTVNSSVGIQETTRKLPVLNATEYAVLQNEAYAASGKELPFPNISGLGKGTNWQNEIFETSPVYNNDINISGGSDKMVYSLSASNLNQEGIIGGPKTGYERNTASYNFV